MFENGLSHKVVLYIPSTTNVQEHISTGQHQQHVDNALTFLAKRFGGATAERAIGAWVAQDGTLVREDITQVYSFAQDFTSDDRLAIYAYCQRLRNTLLQESIAAEIDGKLYFV